MSGKVIKPKEEKDASKGYFLSREADKAGFVCARRIAMIETKVYKANLAPEIRSCKLAENPVGLIFTVWDLQNQSGTASQQGRNCRASVVKGTALLMGQKLNSSNLNADMSTAAVHDI
ncbi:hypothetical protein Q9233_007121 [Columba guinea]|nr:hypothetical protein Q9233_007121 [Columba guinea]